MSVRLGFCLCLLCHTMLAIASTPYAKPSDLVRMDVTFCGIVQTSEPFTFERECHAALKPATQGPLRAWLRIDNTSEHVQKRFLVVSPYYHDTINVYQRNGVAWVLTETGGASLGGHALSASLGGHRFALSLPIGESQLLVEVPRFAPTPKIFHFWVDLENADQPYSSEQLLLALHLGMLLMMLLLMCISWAVEPSILRLRLLLLTTLAPVSVGIGSGAFYLLWPHAVDSF